MCRRDDYPPYEPTDGAGRPIYLHDQNLGWVLIEDPEYPVDCRCGHGFDDHLYSDDNPETFCLADVSSQRACTCQRYRPAGEQPIAR